MNHKPPPLKHQSSRFILRVSLVPIWALRTAGRVGYPCLTPAQWDIPHRLATHLAIASQCQRPVSAGTVPQLPPGAAAILAGSQSQALSHPPGAEHGFGPIIRADKAAAEAQAQFELTNEHLEMPYPSPSCLCQPPWPSSPSLFLSESSPRRWTPPK